VIQGLTQGEVVVIGIGNPLRGDDAAGSLVARRMAAMPGVHVIDAQEVPENYLPLVIERQPDTVVLIDCVELGSPPGAIALLDASQIAEYWPTTHRLPLSLLMSVLEQGTHARIFAIGIQPSHTEFMEPMTEAVAASVERLAGMLQRDLVGSFRGGEVSA